MALIARPRRVELAALAKRVVLAAPCASCMLRPVDLWTEVGRHNHLPRAAAAWPAKPGLWMSVWAVAQSWTRRVGVAPDVFRQLRFGGCLAGRILARLTRAPASTPTTRAAVKADKNGRKTRARGAAAPVCLGFEITQTRSSRSYSPRYPRRGPPRVRAPVNTQNHLSTRDAPAQTSPPDASWCCLVSPTPRHLGRA